MGTFQDWTLYAVQFVGTAELWVDQIVSQRISPGLDNLLISSSSNVEPQYQAVRASEPMLVFETTELLGLMDAFGAKEDTIGATLTFTQVIMWFRQRDSAARFSGSATWVKVTANAATVIPKQLTMRGRDDASITYEIHAVTDGLLDALVTEAAEAAPTGAGGTPSKVYACGPAFDDGTEIDGVQGVTIDFGIEPVKSSKNSDIFVDHINIQRTEPTIDVITRSTDLLRDTLGSPVGISMVGRAISGDCKFYARSRVDGARFEADVATEHIRFTIGAGRILPQEFAVQHQGNAEPVVRFQCNEASLNGDDAIVVVTGAPIVA